MTPTRRRAPAGMTGSCLWALANLNGTATTAQVREWLGLHGEKLTPAQARSCLLSLSRRKPPLVEQARQGSPGWRGTASLWEITKHGRAILAPSPAA